ncbi:MAG: hypothetical protein K6G88_11490 [Lachnospiraceae bacterium]|nr:hypothetical protein [Lachnospiraceae bacterium]
MKTSKTLAVVTSLALIATSITAVGVGAEEEGTEGTAVQYANWTFVQGGMYNPHEPGNEGYIGNVKMTGTNEELTGWLNKDIYDNAEILEKPDAEDSVRQTMTASEPANGFTLAIQNTGWDCYWKDVTGYEQNRINPWSIQANTKFEAQLNHKYTISYTAQASSKKYGMISIFGVKPGENDGDEDVVVPYGDILKDNLVYSIASKKSTFTHTFVNTEGFDEINVNFLLGAFDAQADANGVDISEVIAAVENCWEGKVIISNFTIEDLGEVDPNAETTVDTSNETTVDTSHETTVDTNHETTVDTSNETTVDTSKETTTAPVTTATPATVAPTTAAPTTAAPTTVAPTTKAPETTKAVTKVAKAKIASAKKSGKKIKLTIKKVANAKKYEVKYGTDKKFKKATKTVKTTKVKVTLKKIAKKVYYIKVRAIAADGTAGAWSKVKKVKK